MQWSSRLIVVSTAFFLACSALALETNDTPPKQPDPIPNTNADNTARNVSDRANQALTPIDQGNNKADLAMTAKIRKEILAATNLSVNAQNVKVITNTGKVALRGPVDTTKEKRLIGEIAVRVAEPGNVDNQIEVLVIADSGSLIGQPTAPDRH